MRTLTLAALSLCFSSAALACAMPRDFDIDLAHAMDDILVEPAPAPTIVEPIVVEAPPPLQEQADTVEPAAQPETPPEPRS